MAIEKFPVEKSHVMMFARSIGDSNKIYFDEDYAKESKCEERKKRFGCELTHSSKLTL